MSIECPTCKGTGRVAEAPAPPVALGATCHCDGPPHPYSPHWCPVEGPVTGR